MAPALLRLSALLGLTLLGASCARRDEPTRAALAQMVIEPEIAPGAVTSSDRHLLLTVRSTEEGLEVLDFRQVASPLPLNRGRREQPWRVAVDDSSGKTIYLAQLAAPVLLRGELAGPGGVIEAVHPTVGEQFLAIRLPALAGAATVRLFGPVQGSSPAALAERGHASLPEPEKP